MVWVAGDVRGEDVAVRKGGRQGCSCVHVRDGGCTHTHTHTYSSLYDGLSTSAFKAWPLNDGATSTGYAVGRIDRCRLANARRPLSRRVGAKLVGRAQIERGELPKNGRLLVASSWRKGKSEYPPSWAFQCACAIFRGMFPRQRWWGLRAHDDRAPWLSRRDAGRGRLWRERERERELFPLASPPACALLSDLVFLVLQPLSLALIISLVLPRSLSPLIGLLLHLSPSRSHRHPPLYWERSLRF